MKARKAIDNIYLKGVKRGSRCYKRLRGKKSGFQVDLITSSKPICRAFFVFVENQVKII